MDTIELRVIGIKKDIKRIEDERSILSTEIAKCKSHIIELTCSYKKGDLIEWKHGRFWRKGLVETIIIGGWCGQEGFTYFALPINKKGEKATHTVKLRDGYNTIRKPE